MVTIPDSGGREKKLVAFSSVMAAVFLTSIKLLVGLLTGSLGILAEAAHSGLDLVAAVITYFSVRAADRSPDEGHLYGHGKIENISALVETLLLFITCAWIIYEAIERLFLRPVLIEVTAWSFIVMGVSIIIDISRSRALMKTAKKYSSQALEADALHFSTDVWSSSVVILGLIAVTVGQSLSARSAILANWLFKADSIAAFGVSVIVIYVSWQLGQRTISGLLDGAPEGMAKRLKERLAQLPGVSAVQRVRVRQSGPTTFVDVTLAVARNSSFEKAHEIAESVEMAVRELVPRSDVMVHVEPVMRNGGSLLERVRSVAARQGIDIHDLYVYDTGERLNLELHAEVPDNITVSEAHARVTALEKVLAHESPEFGDVVVHIEPSGDAEICHHTITCSSSDIHEAIAKLGSQLPGINNCHSITVLKHANRFSVSFHCAILSNSPIIKAHELTVRLESLLRERLPGLGRVTIHIEPYSADEQLS